MSATSAASQRKILVLPGIEWVPGNHMPCQNKYVHPDMHNMWGVLLVLMYAQ